MTRILTRPRATKDIWLDAAYDLLIREGIEAVKIMPLAKQMNLTRTGFYWFFKDLSELHSAMITRWESRNTDVLVQHCRKDATSITEALFNLMDCWLDPDLFEAGLDLAIRNWARNDADLNTRLQAADARRIQAVTDMFIRHGFDAVSAQVRGLTVILTQVGYMSMEVVEARHSRLARVQHYVALFAGSPPSDADINRFLSRHPL